ncbi:MAG: CRISPR-associated endonuclease Cas1 [Gammaproteobacteria bacterium]
MGTLLIDRKDVELRRDGARLLVFEQGRRTGSVPVSHLQRVVIQNRALLDSNILGALAEHGVGLVVINQRRPQATASLPGHAHNDAVRRLSQYRCSLDEDWRRQWSARLVLRKLRAQRLLLVRALAQRPDERHALVKAIRALEQRRDNLNDGVDLDRNRIRGFEGAAAAAYFSGFARLFPPALAFTGRNRRPPRDPVNACLSLAYTLLNADAVLALHAAGLDPMLGFYHDPDFGRESLACDFIEPLRPRVDEWIWTLFRQRQLRVEYFFKDKGACLLNKTGRKTFYAEWEGCALPLRRALRRSAQWLARVFSADSLASSQFGAGHE